MKTDIQENLKKMRHNVANPKPKGDMKNREAELHNEIDTHIWFLKKTGWSRQEIDFATLMSIDRETILAYLSRTE